MQKNKDISKIGFAAFTPDDCKRRLAKSGHFPFCPPPKSSGFHGALYRQLGSEHVLGVQPSVLDPSGIDGTAIQKRPCCRSFVREFANL